MARLLSNRPPVAGDNAERTQRVRIGVTGLSAIVLIIALATAIVAGIDHRVERVATAPVAAPAATAPAAEDGKSEPLAQLGVAPDAKDDEPANAAGVR